MRGGSRMQPLWQLYMLLTDENGPIKHNSKYQYRCLACNTWDGGSSSGIKQLEYHIAGNHVRGAQSCSMVTPLLYQMLGVQDPYIDEAGGDYEINVEQDADDQDEPVLNHDIFEEQEVHPPQGFIEATIVLSSHHRMSSLLDEIISEVVNAQRMVLPAPGLEFFVTCRACLLRILERCNQPVEVGAGALEVVSALGVWNEIRQIRDTLGQLQDLFGRPDLPGYAQRNLHTGEETS